MSALDTPQDYRLPLFSTGQDRVVETQTRGSKRLLSRDSDMERAVISCVERGLTEIARGGMGVVDKARQVKLNRVVAMMTQRKPSYPRNIAN